MVLKLLGTREQKENKAGNTGTKAVFREQGTQKSKTREHKENFVGIKGTCTPPPPAPPRSFQKKARPLCNWLHLLCCPCQPSFFFPVNEYQFYVVHCIFCCVVLLFHFPAKLVK